MSWIIGFFLGNWKRLAALIVIAAAVSVWLTFQGLQAKVRETEAELASARQMQATAEARADVAETTAQEVARLNRRLTAIDQALAAGSEQIEAASRSHETLALFVAWGSSDRSLCDAAGGCGTGADRA